MSEYENTQSREALRSSEAHEIVMALDARSYEEDEEKRIEFDHLRWLADDVRLRWSEDERLGRPVSFVDKHGTFAALARYTDETMDPDVRYRAYYKTYDADDAGVEKELTIPRELAGQAVADLYTEDAKLYDFSDKFAARNFIERDDVAKFTEDIGWLREKFGSALFSDRQFLSTPRLRTNEKVVFVGTETLMPFNVATFQ